MNKKVYLFFIGLVAFSACQQQTKPVNVIASADKVPALTQPFRYHKLIEVSPGNDFDVLVWGRGAIDAGSLLILHSDSTNIKYNTLSADFDGTAVDAFNTDMDVDGNPEFFIQASVKDTNHYTHMYAYEFENSRARQMDFPKLTPSQQKGYRGSDVFYVKDGDLIREFPVYEGSGKEAKQTGQKRTLQYSLRNNELSARQVMTDSSKMAITGKQPALTKTRKATVAAAGKINSAKKTTSSSNTSDKKSSSSKKKKTTHHTENTKKRKKRRHSNN